MRNNLSLLCKGLLLLAVLAGESRASVPAFEFFCVWYASEIVLIEQRADEVTVLETWRGGLAPGTVIRQLDLPKMPMEVRPHWPKPNDPPLGSVSGKRVVLFLKPRPAELRDRVSGDWVGAASYWVPPQVAAVWLENDQAYTMQHVFSDEPVRLAPLYLLRNQKPNEREFRQAVDEFLATKDAFVANTRLADPTERVARLGPLATSYSPLRNDGRYHPPDTEVLAALGDCGQAAVPRLKQLLVEYGDSTLWVGRALANAYGDEAPAQMTAILREELAFWRAEAPKWAKETPDKLPGPLQNRQAVLSAALDAIHRSHYVAARDTVVELRDFWISCPQLQKQAPYSYTVNRRCDDVLKALDRPPAALK